MVNAKDAAKIIKCLANDMVKRDMPTILNELDGDSMVDITNGLATLQEISEAIQKKTVKGNDGLFIISTDY